MTRFNRATLDTATATTVNRAGGRAYEVSDEFALASLVLTSFLNDQFYRSAKGSIEEIVYLCERVDPTFAAQVAVFARDRFGMRSTSHVIAAFVAANVKGAQWTKHFFNSVVVRPDDAVHGGRLSHARPP